MTADVVQAKYVELEQVAKRFAQQAEVQERWLREVEQKAERLCSGSWRGKGIDAFSREIDGEVLPAVHRLRDSLQQAATTVQQITSLMQEAELGASRLFASPQGGTTFGPLPAMYRDGPDFDLESVPNQIVSLNGVAVSLKEAIRSLDDLLTPVDLISDNRPLSRVFDKNLEEIGRFLNDLTGQTGHIKMMADFGDFLRGLSKGIGFITNFLDVNEMRRYFAGELTNAEIAEIAIKVLVPIPGINDRLANWATENMADPNGHWRGFAPPVE